MCYYKPFFQVSTRKKQLRSYTDSTSSSWGVNGKSQRRLSSVLKSLVHFLTNSKRKMINPFALTIFVEPFKAAVSTSKEEVKSKGKICIDTPDNHNLFFHSRFIHVWQVKKKKKKYVHKANNIKGEKMIKVK